MIRYETMVDYQRRLTRWQPKDAAIFVTGGLHQSKRRSCDASRSPRLTAGQAFVLDDREWDRAAAGPRWLANERVAQAIADALKYAKAVRKLHALHAWVIMSNHGRLLIPPRAPLSRITKSIKNDTAREADRILGLAGPFWRQKSYDRWIRTEDRFIKTVRYIAGNPAGVGLCEKPETWTRSSVWTGRGA